MNFIFFFPDEMRASSVSCFGNNVVKMPNYDRLASEGVCFDDCSVQNPVCSPSRCCTMTGLYPHNNGHRTLWHLLRPHEPNLFGYLKDAGYDIAWYGKNDLFSQKLLDEYCADISEKRNGYKSMPSRPTGRVSGQRNPYPPDDPRYYTFLYSPIPEPDGELPLDINVARGIDFLRSRKTGDKPFFLYLPLSMPHPPYTALERFYNMYSAEPDIPIGADAIGEPKYAELIRRYRRLDKLDADFFSKIYSVYLGMNSYCDFLLGELLDALDETGLKDDTTIIVSSDHGDWAGSRGLVEKWPNSMYDELVRVPLIIYSPGCKAGHRVTSPNELFDIMPTILELAGIEPRHTHFAHSLLPMLRGGNGDPNRAVFCEGGYDPHEPHCSEAYTGSELHAKDLLDPNNIYYPKVLQQKEHPESVCRTVMIKQNGWKLVRRTSGDNGLYNLTADPHELTNLYNHTEYDDKRRELETALLDWYIKTSDTVPTTDDPRGF